MSRRLKVSAAQLGPINRADSRQSVVARLVEMLKEADSRGSKFVVFPELALTTFFPRWWMEDQAEVDKYFEVGDIGFNVWKMFKEDVIVGQCICNDRRWPETFRVMGLKGAEMVVLGYNTPTDNVYAPKEPPYLRVFHHNLSIQAAAYQNGIWVVATAKAGKEDGFWLHGGTAIVAPTGEIVAKSNTEEDEVVSYDCDMELGEYIRNTTFNFARHRRPEHYKLITERTGVKVEPSN